ncbi:uncharacterized protein plekhg6 isoform X1 [Anguilla anguilla]|uniref:uncharacterized protein plekhg6 isoform X1 n=1 Tax=Anguilla anguilla TaxID=7936 RepID=UPI0015A77F0C|nr:uncharacterized protein plekhg6 isoform X1 [Anguilla anguilla]
MDPGSPSPFSKPPTLNPRGSDVVQIEEVPLNTLGRWDPGRDAKVEKLWASEKEIESVVDGVIPTAVTQINHTVAADKQRFNTIGYANVQTRLRNSVVPEFSTVNRGLSGNVRARGTLRQVFSQGLSERPPIPELEIFKQTLQSFPIPALPDWKGGGDGGGDWGEGGGEGEGGEVTDVTLEGSWTDIVHSHTSMSKKRRHQQEALWELIHTELSYIRKLTIVHDLAMAALVYVRKNGFLSEVTPELLFSNLPSILQAHRLFWQEVLLPIIQEVRETGKPFDPMKLESGCLQFSERFSPYLQYCWEEKRILEFAREKSSDPLFQTYQEWVETCPQVGRMRLGEMQAQPHQRITKYHLLLEAILKYTQDRVELYSVRKMLTSVNGFVDSINDYLTFKDDELALSKSAQRVEGYEVAEVMSEEIEKHVKEFSCFDLTSPIRGLGPGDMRKLLLEETLKIREKKDNKAEVVVLLFSDVLLVAKAQKKSEKLKVVRPPMALERIRCAILKDGCSFVLVDMGELGCAVNVHTVFTSSPESCSTWVTAILNAQTSLAAGRDREMSHRLVEFRQVTSEIEKPILHPSDTERVIGEREEQVNQLEVVPVNSLGKKPKKEASKELSANGTLRLTEVEKNPQNQLKNLMWVDRNIPSSQSARGNFAMGRSNGQNSQSGKKDVVMSKREAKEDSGSARTEFSENLRPGITERRVTWNQTRGKPDSLNLNKPVISSTVSTKGQSNASHSLLPGKQENREITHSESAPSLALPPDEEFNMDTSARESASKESPLQGKFTRKDSEGQSSDQHSRKDSDISQSEEESLRFSRRLISPRLRRRRPVDVQQSPGLGVFRKGSLDLGDSVFTFNANSSPTSDPDSKQRVRKTGQKPAQKSHSHLGHYIRRNHGVLQNGAAKTDRPEPELSIGLPEQSSQKRHKVRTQRSVSIPDIIIHAGSPEARMSQSSQPYFSPGDLLERARERAKERTGEAANTGMTSKKNFFFDLTPSPSRSTSPSLSPDEADVEFPGALSSTVTNYGGAENEKEEEGYKERKYSSSFPFPDGASVDGSGWCIGDDEVRDLLLPNGIEGAGGADDGGSRTLTLSDLRRISRQEDGECSEV